MSKILTRQHFKLRADMWRRHETTVDLQRITAAVEAAVTHQLLISITGSRGSGKTYAVNQALANGPDVRLVAPLRLTREKMHLGDIEVALVRDLSHEAPRRSAEARSHQVRRILGAVSRETPVLLMIDDAHVLHHATLRGLKRLREFAWMGKSPLLGIVLIGQFDRTAAIPEVGLRSDQLALVGLSSQEIFNVLMDTLGPRMEMDSAHLIADLDAARNWLDLQYLVDLCLEAALATGAASITTEVVQAVLYPGRVEAPVSAPADDLVGAFLQAGGKQRKVA